MKILLVEDEQRLAGVVKEGLVSEGFSVDIVCVHIVCAARFVQLGFLVSVVEVPEQDRPVVRLVERLAQDRRRADGGDRAGRPAGAVDRAL